MIYVGLDLHIAGSPPALAALSYVQRLDLHGIVRMNSVFRNTPNEAAVKRT